MSLFCLQMTTLFVYDYGIEYNNPFNVDKKSPRLNESQLIQLATKSPNVRNLRINRPVLGLTTNGLDRLAQLWPRVEELDLRGSGFDEQELGNFTRLFPLLKKLKISVSFYAKVQLFEILFSNHPNLVNFELNLWSEADRNWFLSCHVPLERFVVNRLLDEDATLDTLENCCKDSLQTIQVGFQNATNSQPIRRIFSTFHQLSDVSLSLIKYSTLPHQPVLRHLEKLCLDPDINDTEKPQIVIDFLKSYPQLKELHLEQWDVDDEFIEKIVNTLPNLRSLSFAATEMTRAGWMNVTSLKKLEYFNAGYETKGSVEDVLAFVRETPSLQRLSIWKPSIKKNDFLVLFKALRDDIRSSGSNRQLLVSRDDVKYFALDSSDKCTDLAIEEFVNEMNNRTARKFC